MGRRRLLLTGSLLSGALALLTYYGTIFLTEPLSRFYRNASGLDTAQNIAEWAAWVTSVGLIVAAVVVAANVALQPVSWRWKLIAVMPGALLVLTIAGAVMDVAGIGTVGNVVSLSIQGVQGATFAQAWLAVCMVLTSVAVTVAVVVTHLGPRTAKTTGSAVAVTAVPALVAGIAMIASVIIVIANSATTPTFGRPDRAGQGVGDAPLLAVTPALGSPASPGRLSTPSTGPAGSGAQPGQSTPGGGDLGAPIQGSQSTPGAGNQGTPGQGNLGAVGPSNQGTPGPGSQGTAAPSRQTTPGASGQAGPGGGQPGSGASGQGGFPGGPGGPGGSGSASTYATRYKIGGSLMLLLVAIELACTAGLVVSMRRAPRETGEGVVQSPTIDVGKETRRALTSGVAVLGIALLLSQVAQVSHDNPRAQGAPTWDSALTQRLATAACMDCHSNYTKWPWYSYVAPASWLTAGHVHSGRSEMNLSELNAMPAFRRSSLANQMAEQIRSDQMPPKDYRLIHAGARLSAKEKEELITGLQKTFANSGQSQAGG